MTTRQKIVGAVVAVAFAGLCACDEHAVETYNAETQRKHDAAEAEIVRQADAIASCKAHGGVPITELRPRQPPLNRNWSDPYIVHCEFPCRDAVVESPMRPEAR